MIMKYTQTKFQLTGCLSIGYYLNLCSYFSVDKPDPYVKVRIPKTKMPSYKTVHKENTHDPEWNEEFDFIIDPEIKNILSKAAFIFCLLFPF